MSVATPHLEALVDEELVEAVRERRKERGESFPRIALFLFDCGDADQLRRTLARIPEPVVEWLEEVVVMQERVAGPVLPPVAELLSGRHFDLRVHRPPRDLDYGGVRKAAFEYALLRGFDQAISMRGDGLHPPEALPLLIHAVLETPRRAALASRLVLRRGGALSLARIAAHVVATSFQNRVLGLRLRDYHTSFRVYPRWALERIPFQLNAGDRSFDMQIVIQLRALGAPPRELPVPPVWREYDSGRAGLSEVLRACATAVDYRLHQLHLSRLGPYLFDTGVHYTLKRASTGSHMQIVSAIRPDSRVLDLGCSQGLLAGPLRERGVEVTGVDSRESEGLAEELAAYHRRDLEQPLELPLGRSFDYVVISDVIEHLRERNQLLRSARRFLVEGGRLIISTPNVALWFYRLSLLVGRFEYGPRGVLDETHVHLFTRATFRREVERAGYQVVSEKVTSLPFEVVFRSTGRSRFVRSIARAYHLLARLWPEMFAYQIILEAEITTLDEESTSP